MAFFIRYNENKFIEDIKKMKHTKNFEIIYLIYYILRRRLRKVNQFLNEKENQRIKECNDKYK